MYGGSRWPGWLATTGGARAARRGRGRRRRAVVSFAGATQAPRLRARAARTPATAPSGGRGQRTGTRAPATGGRARRSPARQVSQGPRGGTGVVRAGSRLRGAQPGDVLRDGGRAVVLGDGQDGEQVTPGRTHPQQRTLHVQQDVGGVLRRLRHHEVVAARRGDAQALGPGAGQPGHLGADTEVARHVRRCQHEHGASAPKWTTLASSQPVGSIDSSSRNTRSSEGSSSASIGPSRNTRSSPHLDGVVPPRREGYDEHLAVIEVAVVAASGLRLLGGRRDDDRSPGSRSPSRRVRRQARPRR